MFGLAKLFLFNQQGQSPWPNTPSLPESIMSHVSIGTNDFDRAKAFYTAVLGAMEIRVIMEHPGAIAFGRAYPEFWVGVPHDGGKAHVGNGSHFGFLAVSKAQVDAFYAKALEMGGKGMVRLALGLCMGRSITAALCGTWMGTRLRRSFRILLRADLRRAC
jgi:predicted enzyme related to lactoylglutathione lyase